MIFRFKVAIFAIFRSLNVFSLFVTIFLSLFVLLKIVNKLANLLAGIQNLDKVKQRERTTRKLVKCCEFACSVTHQQNWSTSVSFLRPSLAKSFRATVSDTTFVLFTLVPISTLSLWVRLMVLQRNQLRHIISSVTNK